jgi:pimeloyl-ACP methyl ester carboxylesterase
MATLAYTESGSGTPLVLLHAFPFDARMWQGQSAELRSSHRVILPDLPGFGSSAPSRAFTIESAADEVHTLLSGINALPCVLGGLSMGGYIAMAFARKYPQDLKSLILLDTKAPPDDEKARDGRNTMIDLARASGTKAVVDQMLPKLVAPGVLKTRPQIDLQLRQIAESQPAETIVHALAALRDRPDALPGLAKIAVPTLIIVGDGDQVTPPSAAEQMQLAIPGSSLAVIRGAGHMSAVEQPGQVNQAIRRFL